MVEFSSNITTSAWDEALFDCRMTSKGKDLADEINRRFLEAEEGQSYKEELSISKVPQEYGGELLGSGISRMAYDPPEDWTTGSSDCILKIQWDSFGNQNANEIALWQNANGRQAAILNPVLEYGGMRGWLLVPKAESYTNVPIADLKEMVKTLRRTARDVGFVTDDVRMANVGRVEGRDVITDYGTLAFKNKP